MNENNTNFTEISNQMREFETNRKQFMFDVGNLKNTFDEYVHQRDL